MFEVRSILLFMLLAASATKAQDAPCVLVLQGNVVDAHDRSSLSYAEIYLPELERGTVADGNGVFELSGLCPAPLRMRITHVGCEPVEVVVDPRREKRVTIRLEHHVEELKVMEVQRARPDENVGQAQRTLDREELARASGRTLSELLQAVPGVNVLASGPTIGKPVIHGLSGNRILILNQGVRQEDQQWGAEHAPGLDPFSSDRITVVKGAAAVQYGSDAIGGVIITEPVDLPRDPGIRGEFQGLGLWNGRGGGGRALLQGGVPALQGLGWRLQASTRRMGDSEAPDYVLNNTGVREAGVSGALGFRTHRLETTVYYSWFGRELGIMRAAHIGNLTDLYNAINTGRPWYVGDFTYTIDAPRQTAQHLLLKAELGWAISDRNKLVATYGYQADDRQEFDIRRAGRSATPALDLFLVTHTGDVVFKHWLGPHVHGRMGVSGVVQENSNIPGTGVRPLIPDYDKWTLGMFLLEHVPVNDHLELEAGARFERTRLDVVRFDVSNQLQTPTHQFDNHAISVGANWSISDSVRLRINVSSAFRPPHVSELYSEGLHHGAAAIEVGDATLKGERSVKAVSDLEVILCEGRVRIDLTGHVDRIDNFIQLTPAGTELTIRGAFPVFRYNATDALLWGGDLGARYTFAPQWTWQLQASTVRGRDLERDEWLFQMPSDRMENSLLWSMPRRNGRGSLELGPVSLLVLQQERIPVGMDFTDPPATYHLLGFNVNLEGPLGGNVFRAGLRVTNLLNTSYRDYMDRFRYYADARGIDVALWFTYVLGTP
ncbi:MAG: TonB-dependent receptor [Flavobacteriales bacterium]|nr:TonB-dependent receptor [Flavobacteriales bacterium]